MNSERKNSSFAIEYSFHRKVCRSEYGVAPNVQIDGHVHSIFPYITTPLNYIVPEMLKNAFR